MHASFSCSFHLGTGTCNSTLCLLFRYMLYAEVYQHVLAFTLPLLHLALACGLPLPLNVPLIVPDLLTCLCLSC